MTSNELLYLCLVLVTFAGFAAMLVGVARHRTGPEQIGKAPHHGA